MKHELDRVRMQQEMEKRGWKLDQYYSWISPIGGSRHTRENDWVESILASVICPHSQPSLQLPLPLQPESPRIAISWDDPSKIVSESERVR